MPPKKKKALPRPVHFETTLPVIRPCSVCGVWFAAGVAEGLKAEVEFVPLDLGQRLWAVLNKVELYWIWRTGLVHLDASRLSGRQKGNVYPQHHCHVKWPVPTRQSTPARPDRNVPPPF